MPKTEGGAANALPAPLPNTDVVPPLGAAPNADVVPPPLPNTEVVPPLPPPPNADVVPVPPPNAEVVPPPNDEVAPLVLPKTDVSAACVSGLMNARTA